MEDALKIGWLATQTELVLRGLLRTMQNIRGQVLSFEAACHETRDDTSPQHRFSLECWCTQSAEGRDALCLFAYLASRNCSEALENLAWVTWSRWLIDATKVAVKAASAGSHRLSSRSASSGQFLAGPPTQWPQDFEKVKSKASQGHATGAATDVKLKHKLAQSCWEQGLA